MAWVVDLLSWSLLLGGACFCAVGGVGLLRMPDFYTRLHASGVVDTMGAGLILVGLMLQAGLTLATVKLAFILAFLLLTSPTAAHAIAHAAYTRGLEPLQQVEPPGERLPSASSST